MEEKNTKICTRCGNTISSNASICPICGEGRTAPKNKWEDKLSNIKTIENTGKPKKRLVLLLLAWIGIGFGYYYLGYQDKFINRAALYIKIIIYMITIILIPYSLILMFYMICLHLYDFIYLVFIVKHDAYGNKIKFI